MSTLVARPCRRVPLRLRRAVVLAAAITTTGAVPAHAGTTTFYVDGASRGGQCSDAHTVAQNAAGDPWCTLAQGIELAPDGSTIYVRAGTYGRVTVTGADKRSYVTVAPYAGEEPAIAGMTLTDVSYLRFRDLKTTSGVVLKDSHHMEFVGGESALWPVGRATPTAFMLNGVTDVLIAGRDIHDGFSGVIVLGTQPGARRVTVRDNVMQRMGADGVYVGRFASDVDVLRNHMIDVRARADVSSASHSDAVQVVGPTTDVVVEGNVVRGGRGFLFMIGPEHRNLVCCAHVNARIVNNELVGNSFALRTWSLVNARIVNNTVWGTTDGPATGVNIYDRYGSVNPRTTDLVFANNIIKQFTLGGGVDFAVRSHNLVNIGPLAPGDLDGAPLFADAFSADFGLVPGSLGVDDGLASVAPPTDRLGRGRRGAPDIGALELWP